ncbi:response regulator transcription factor [bacterium]|jgi:DNA-binding NarL/FixJ family response regulator|nr:response regulator transcription factor [bacterium]
MGSSEETQSTEQIKAPQKQIAIMLVEDHLITRMGLRFALEQVRDLIVVAEAADGNIAVTTALQVKPNVILMDIGLPGLNGIEAAKQIKAKDGTIGIVMLTSHSLDEDILAALAANCDGYCLKDVAADQLVNAIRTVHNGGIWLDPAIAKRVIKTFVEQKPITTPVNSSTLTDRELEVLTLVVEGLSNQEIAERLILSTETIKTHMRHLMEKLSVSDRTQAAVKALRTGLV